LAYLTPLSAAAPVPDALAPASPGAPDNAATLLAGAPLEVPASALRLQAARLIASAAAIPTLSALTINLLMTILSSVYVMR
jgi:hypothetical protein